MASSSAFPVKADFQAVDETVLEYLLYRGFTRSFRTVAADCQSDRTRAFDAETVVKEVFDLIQQHDLQGFHALWCFLEARFFSHLDAHHTRTVSELHGVAVALAARVHEEEPVQPPAQLPPNRSVADLAAAELVREESFA